jgi:phosphoglycolate phosphatase-like HAD superfamily hydrolase
MKIDAIIFDKDGTLLDFDAFWVTVSKYAVEVFLEKLSITEITSEEILKAFGINGDKCDVEGILCKGTYEKMGETVFSMLKNPKYTCEEIITHLTDAYNETAHKGIIKPVSPLQADTLKKLKSQGKKLILVTTDNLEITKRCLEGLNLWTLFDKIYVDDGKTPLKPHPFAGETVSEFFNINKENILMVGDTVTDIKFARNVGIKVISIAKDQRNRELLTPLADGIISDMSELLDIVE